VKLLLAALLLALAEAAAARPFDPADSALLQSVETSGCEMERNGERHDAQAAAEHLRVIVCNARAGRQ